MSGQVRAMWRRLFGVLALVVVPLLCAALALTDGASAGGCGGEGVSVHVYDGQSAIADSREMPGRSPEKPSSPRDHGSGVAEAFSYDDAANLARSSARPVDAGSAPSTAARFGGLSRAPEFGVQPYRALTGELRGSGLQAHHLIERRFAGVLGEAPSQMLSVAVTRAEHQAFTNAWRQAIPYGSGTANATRQQVLVTARQIYGNHPEILRALGL